MTQLAPSARVTAAHIRHLLDTALFAMWDLGASHLHRELGPQAEQWKRLHDGLDADGLAVDTKLSPEQIAVCKTFLSKDDRCRLEILLGERD